MSKFLPTQNFFTDLVSNRLGLLFVHCHSTRKNEYFWSNLTFMSNSKNILAKKKIQFGNTKVSNRSGLFFSLPFEINKKNVYVWSYLEVIPNFNTFFSIHGNCLFHHSVSYHENKIPIDFPPANCLLHRK